MACKVVINDAAGSGTLALKRYKVTKTYTDFSDTDTQKDIEIFSLPTGTAIVDVFSRVTTAFSGGAISAYTISVGIAGTLTKYQIANDAMAAAAYTAVGTKGTGLTTAGATNVESFTAATSIRADANSTTANLNAATQGSIDIYIIYLDIE